MKGPFGRESPDCLAVVDDDNGKVVALFALHNRAGAEAFVAEDERLAEKFRRPSKNLCICIAPHGTTKGDTFNLAATATKGGE